ncbi:MAG: TIGR03960 family B12-binding radical SAM protein [Sphaerochaetaceae bacterium]
MKKFDIVKEFGNELIALSNPVRYIGGEYSYGPKKPLLEKQLHIGLCFPDLYEIGMSNNAMRLLYNQINSIGEDVLCDRVFSVAHDFEQFLKEKKIKLYTLEHGLFLDQLDILGISIGYELAATNILQVLELGNIPLHVSKRKEKDPIVIAGGPAVTNPLPFSPFFDFIYIGESEAGLQQIVDIVKNGKFNNISRTEIINELKSLPFLWHKDAKRVKRAIDNEFTQRNFLYNHYVVPHFKVAQDNGVVEIMRGCPSGCRFCHAGQFYKPYRQKEYSQIKAEVDQHVHDFGYREVTLSSLSSGDHPQIKETITNLNSEFDPYHISFSLPSLKVSSFSLGILEELSRVRKSGLTFAIETPLEKWQRLINKLVPIEQIIEIIKEAKQRGWRLAKFYFMVGLPTIEFEEEYEAIISFLKQIWDETHIGMNINIGTFIPKAHTPFQWAPQITLEQSNNHLRRIKKGIQDNIKGAKVSFHEPFVSYLEGIFSRGDEKVATLIEQGYKNGARFDAWDEHLNKELWKQTIKEVDENIDLPIINGFSEEDSLPWDSVSLGVAKKFLLSEWLVAKENQLTPRCFESCLKPCGVCGTINKVVEPKEEIVNLPKIVKRDLGLSKPVVFTYQKKERGTFISHINVMRLFEQTFQRSKLDVAFTQGFNPKPKMEFLNPLTTGITGLEEKVLVHIHDVEDLDYQKTIDLLNYNLSSGFQFDSYQILDVEGRYTLSKRLVGSTFRIFDIKDKSYLEALESLVGKKGPSFSVKKEDSSYLVYVNGEQNLIKLIFGKDVNKFEVLSKLSIERLRLDINY